MVLLRTKLSIPNPSGCLIERKQLLDSLDEGLTRKLTLVCAPAGSGKTCLLSDWAAKRSSSAGGSHVPVAWISLGEREDSPEIFWELFTAALNNISIKPLPDWYPKGELPGLNDLALLMDMTFSHIPSHFAIILDNYQFIQDPAIHNAVNSLFDLQPAQMHMYITSRSEPPLSLALLRACDQLHELRGSQLFFSTSESIDFLSQSACQFLSADEIYNLHTRTEGWIAGLKLAARVCQENPGAHEISFSFNGNHHYISDYFADQIFNVQSLEVQNFLLRTSPLHKLNRPMCEAVTGLSNCTEILEHLNSQNLFILPLDSTRSNYRYHRLFADYLQIRLRRENPEQWIEINQRAASWCEEHTDYENTIRYAVAAKEHERAAHWVKHSGHRIVSQQRFAGLFTWLGGFPEYLFEAQPSLCIDYAWSVACSGLLDDVEPLLHTAEKILAEPTLPEDSKKESNLAHVKLLRTFVNRYKDIDQAMIHCSEAMNETVPEEPQIHCLATYFMGHIHLLKGDRRTAENYLMTAIHESRQIAYPAGYFSAIYQLVNLRILEGRLREAFNLCNEGVEQAAHFEDPSTTGIEHICAGRVMHEWNRLTEARNRINTGLKLAQGSGDFIFRSEGHIALALLEMSLGNLETSAQHLRTVKSLNKYARYPAGSLPYRALQARLSLLQGDLPAAEYWAQNCDLKPNSGLHFRSEFEMITLARVHHALGRFIEAQTILERLLPFTKSMGRNGRAIEIFLVLAQVYQSLGKQEDALISLEQALEIAMPEGYIRIFLDEGKQIENLLSRLRKSRDFKNRNFALQHYVDELLLTIGQPQKTRQLASDQADPSPTVENLSEREVQVLQLIAQGRSYDAIARELVVAVSTIQWHIKNIYQKLGAHSATEAVAIAHQFNLLE